MVSDQYFGGETILADTKLRALKATGKLYKVADRDGLYVAVTPAGAISFRYNYKVGRRQETMTFGIYGPSRITLAEAREMQLAAKKTVQEGGSPAREKGRAKARDEAAGTFGDWALKWLSEHKMGFIKFRDGSAAVALGAFASTDHRAPRCLE